ncbi:O-antigen polymerase [Tetragenococcus koreensis]|uniref:O-antigen polymerase n=1 Tax=Tetragenococcus koreensis TaxID=290335 RepID=UPI00399D7A15
MKLMIFSFGYFFHYLAPLIQIRNGVFPNYLPIDNQYIPRVNLILLIFYTVILFLPSLKMNFLHSNKLVAENITKSKLDLFNVITILMLIMVTLLFGPNYFLGKVSIYDFYNTSISLIIIAVINGVSVANFLYTLLFITRMRNSNNFFRLFFSFIPFVLINNIFTLSRYYLAFIIILFVIVFFRDKIRPFSFMFLLFIGITILFPILNIFRDGVDIYLTNDILSRLSEQYTQLHFDSYSQIITSLKYVDNRGYMLGKTTISSLLFFLPRSIFTVKTEGLGYVLAEYLGETTVYGQILGDFNNLSASFISEIFVNFSYFGLLLVPWLLFFILKHTKIESEPVLYGILLGFSFFIMRGDFMSSFAYFIGAIVIIYFIPKKFFS